MRVKECFWRRCWWVNMDEWISWVICCVLRGSTLWLYLRECNTLSWLVQMPTNQTKVLYPSQKFWTWRHFRLFFVWRQGKWLEETKIQAKAFLLSLKLWLGVSEEIQRRQNVKSWELSEFDMRPKWKPGINILSAHPQCKNLSNSRMT